MNEIWAECITIESDDKSKLLFLWWSEEFCCAFTESVQMIEHYMKWTMLHYVCCFDLKNTVDSIAIRCADDLKKGANGSEMTSAT